MAFVIFPAAVVSTLLKAGKIAVRWDIAKRWSFLFVGGLSALDVVTWGILAHCVPCTRKGWIRYTSGVSGVEKRDTGHESARMLPVVRRLIGRLIIALVGRIAERR